MIARIGVLLSACACACACACGCNAITGVDDLLFDLPPDQTTPTSCVEASAGMRIEQDTTLCAGTFSLPAAPGAAAIAVVGAGVTLTCLDTVLDGGAGSGGLTDEGRSIGLRIEADDVTVIGCGARGYGYGIAAVDIRNPTLRMVRADDNFHHPEAGWIPQDHPEMQMPYDLPGGGIVFESVVGGRVEQSSFARNWNGFELRHSEDVSIVENAGPECSNTGIQLVDAHRNTVESNDFSRGIRGQGLSYPRSWYGVTTYDSSAVLIEGGSTENTILDNDATYSGNGIFVRDRYGACPQSNLIADNDVSFSPHNGIECWCDHNVIDGNYSNSSHYGIWAGGSDWTVIRRNRIENSIVDGISIQVGENRHNLIEDNYISASGRVGMLLSGREYQAGAPLTCCAGLVFNANQTVVQRNQFALNIEKDAWLASSRLAVFASNCAMNPWDMEALGNENHGLDVIACQDATGREPPAAALEAVPVSAAGTAIALDASASAPGPSGGTLTFHWLVQRAGFIFPGGAVPAPLHDSTGAASQIDVTVPPLLAGLYDVDVVVDDGYLAALAHRTLVVPPIGVPLGRDAAAWAADCPEQGCSTEISDEQPGELGRTRVHVKTNALYEVSVFTPPEKNGSYNASAAAGRSALGFFLRALNPNEDSWQGSWPKVVLHCSDGTRTYEPDVNLLPREPSEWMYIAVPLAGNVGGWKLTGTGNLAQVNWISIHVDTYGGGFELWLEGMTIY